jgi:hypothetical protein
VIAAPPPLSSLRTRNAGEAIQKTSPKRLDFFRRATLAQRVVAPPLAMTEVSSPHRHPEAQPRDLHKSMGERSSTAGSALRSG